LGVDALLLDAKQDIESRRDIIQIILKAELGSGEMALALC
jgi:hypothetical protein